MIKIDNFCHQCNPCKHYVDLGSETDLMSGPEISKLFINGENTNVKITYTMLKHFSKYFTSDKQYEYLEELRQKTINNKSIELVGNSDLVHEKYHNKPLITYSKMEERRYTENSLSIIKAKKIDTNKFIIKFNDIKAKLPEIEFIVFKNFYCVSNGKKIVPNSIIKIKYSNSELKYYGKCINNNFTDLLGCQLPIINDIEFEIDAIDNVYLEILTDVFSPFSPKAKLHDEVIFLNTVKTHEYLGTVCLNKLCFETIQTNSMCWNKFSGYYSKIFIYSENLNNILSISLKINNQIYLDDVEIDIIKVNSSLLVIPLGCGNTGTIFNNKQLDIKIKTINNLNVQVEVYGEKQNLITNSQEYLDYNCV